jgi:hypothetical protein
MPGATPFETAEGAGKTGCPLHPRPTRKKYLRVRALTTGTGGITPAFPAQWFTAYFALSPVNQLVATVIFERRMPTRRLGACIGAPGPRDFAVRKERRSSISLIASTASRPAFVTTRPPLVPRRDRSDFTPDSTFWKTELFLARELDRILRRCPSGKSPAPAARTGSCGRSAGRLSPPLRRVSVLVRPSRATGELTWNRPR